MSRHLAAFAAVIGVLALSMSVRASQSAPARQPLLDNSTVEVVRLLLPPGARETPHTHPYSVLAIQLTRGDVEMRKANEVVRETRAPGAVDFVARDVSHAAANVGGQPLELVTIALKPDRRPGGQAPPAPPPAGITRTPVIDTADATVVRLDFAPSARETVHTHPYDLVVVFLTAGRAEFTIGSRKDVRVMTPGETFFVPRLEPHAIASLAPEPLAVLGVVIK